MACSDVCIPLFHKRTGRKVVTGRLHEAAIQNPAKAGWKINLIPANHFNNLFYALVFITHKHISQK